jgi:histone deacetylase complex subunit SAP18
MSALPDVLPSPAIGTRVSFRLVFPDTRAPEGRYTARDVGSVVIGDLNEEMENGGGSVKAGSVRLEGDAEKTLRDARFVVGDFVSCAIFPPGKDGSVMPLGVGTGGGLRGPAMRENGYGGGFRGREGGGRATFGGGARGRGGAGLSYGRLGAEEGVPNGEWRRGERVPGPETSSRGFGRGRGRDY